MGDYTKVNIKEDVDDSAQRFGLSGFEGRFANNELGLEKLGMSYQRYEPGVRLPFGHKHKQQEEVYVIVSGGGRIKLDDEIIEVKQWDAIRVPPDTMRAFEAGPDGAELIAIGAPNTGPGDADMTPGWWSG